MKKLTCASILVSAVLFLKPETQFTIPEEVLLHQGQMMHGHLGTVTHSTMAMQGTFTASLDEARYKQGDMQWQLNEHETALQDEQEN